MLSTDLTEEKGSTPVIQENWGKKARNAYPPGEFQTILVVDDNPTNLKVLTTALSAVNLKVAVAMDGETALEQVQYCQPSLILLDLMMPGIDGFETCQRLKRNPLTQEIPIIFMTALDDMDCKIKGLSLGAVDYITKPFQQAEVIARIQVHLQLQYCHRTLQLQNQRLQLEVQRRETIEAQLQKLNTTLQQQRDLAQVTLNSIADGVVTTDADGCIQTFNPVAERLTGWRLEEVRGQSIHRIFHLVDEVTFQPHPLQLESLFSAEKQGISGGEHQLLVARNGNMVAIDHSVSPIKSYNGRIEGAVLVFRDITQARQMAKELSRQASYDVLTELVNRREFERQLTEAIATARYHHQTHCLCFIDLDRFKVVNDVCGHPAGDELLRQIGHLLRNNVRKEDTVARLGGDEFAILFRNCSVYQAEEIVEDLRQFFDGFRFVYQAHTFNVGCSLGLAEINELTPNPADILSAADAACYAAKKRGGMRLHIYHQTDRDIAAQREDAQWIVRLNDALENHRFCLHYQPIIPLQDHAPSYGWHEVLLRLIDDTGEMILPKAFMPAAERYGLMPQIDRWVIQTLLANRQEEVRQSGLRDLTKQSPRCYMVNLSGATLNDDQFADFVENQLHYYQVPPQMIGFEITESVAISNFCRTTQLIQRLKALGCHFALDDFGSGLSSFTYLKKLPVDYLKIDGSLVRESAQDSIALSIIEAISRIGHIVGFQTIAEAIESKIVCDTMAAIGIDHGQGVFLGSPQPDKRVS